MTRKLSLWDTAKPSVPSNWVKRIRICLQNKQGRKVSHFDFDFDDTI